jgi:putative toxin-antitoxin system antitoxin component (TIGR02293 family)
LQKGHDIVSVLGGYRSVGRQIRNTLDFDKLIREGIPSKASDHLKKTLNLTDDELAAFLGISSRTIRRIRRYSGRLPFIASDRLYRIARILSLAIAALEGQTSASEWLHSPQTRLGGKVPFELLDTHIGTKEVENLLGKIQHRIVS